MPVTGWRGRDAVAVAWFDLCLACAELVDGQMELVEDRPSGAKIQIWRCRTCGYTRACHPRYTTRCHVCLDERTEFDLVLPPVDGLAEDFAAWRDDPEVSALLRADFGLGDDEWLSDVQVHIALTALDYENELAFYERPGWTVLAGDIRGRPWGLLQGRAHSHGIWGRHEACGAVQNLRNLRECAVCPPEPGSRTHRGRAEQPYLLYLVGFDHPQLGPLVKYGVGDPARVRAHLGGGCVPLLVLRGTFRDVVAAEQVLRARYEAAAVGPIAGVPPSWGKGREVVRADLDVDLHAVLVGDDVADVTDTLGRWVAA